jgi:hypothetical protein
MDDVVQVGQCVRVVEHDVGHGVAVEGTVGTDDALAEALDHGREACRCPAAAPRG